MIRLQKQVSVQFCESSTDISCVISLAQTYTHTSQTLQLGNVFMTSSSSSLIVQSGLVS